MVWLPSLIALVGLVLVVVKLLLMLLITHMLGILLLLLMPVRVHVVVLLMLIVLKVLLTVVLMVLSYPTLALAAVTLRGRKVSRSSVERRITIHGSIFVIFDCEEGISFRAIECSRVRGVGCFARRTANTSKKRRERERERREREGEKRSLNFL